MVDENRVGHEAEAKMSALHHFRAESKNGIHF